MSSNELFTANFTYNFHSKHWILTCSKIAELQATGYSLIVDGSIQTSPTTCRCLLPGIADSVHSFQHLTHARHNPSWYWLG